MSAYWPIVQARLFTLLPTLLPADVVVFDGPSAGAEKGARKYVTVGATTEGAGGSYDQPDSTTDTLRTEAGTVVCEFVDWSGDVAIATKRDQVFAYANLLEASIRADQTLGVLPKASTTTLTGDLVLTATAARLVVTVVYFVPASS